MSKIFSGFFKPWSVQTLTKCFSLLIVLVNIIAFMKWGVLFECIVACFSQFYCLPEIELFLTIYFKCFKKKNLTNLISHRVYWLLCVYIVYGQTVKQFIFQDILGSIKAAVQIRHWRNTTVFACCITKHLLTFQHLFHIQHYIKVHLNKLKCHGKVHLFQ